MDISFDSKSDDNDIGLIFKENENSIFNYHSNHNTKFSINNLNSFDLNENSFNPFVQSNIDNKQELSHLFNKSNSEEIKTKEASNNKIKEELNVIIKNDEEKMPEIIRNIRVDNDKIKIKLAVAKKFIEEYNKNVKDKNLNIDNFNFDEFKKISIRNNLSLGKTTWEEIILNYYIGNKEIIKNIIKNIYDNKEMKHKKYKETIEKLILEKKVEFLEIKKYVTFGVKNKNVKMKLKSEENLFKDFVERNYKINRENEFESFLKQKYEISIDLTENENNDIDKYINNLRDLVKNFDNWFINKNPRESKKKMFQINFE